LAIGSPEILMGVVSVSEIYVTTSGRPEASRWSSTSQRGQLLLSSYPMGLMGRRQKGTGLAGSEMYSSKAASPGFGASSLSFNPARR